MVSRSTRCRRRRRATALGCRVEDLPDNRGRHGNHARGSHHPRWNHGRLVASDGYVLLRVGRTHPLADPNGYAREHELIIVAALGRRLRDDEIIHHTDYDRTNNRVENLQIMTRAEHNHLHNNRRDRNDEGRFVNGREWDEIPPELEIGDA